MSPRAFRVLIFLLVLGVLAPVRAPHITGWSTTSQGVVTSITTESRWCIGEPGGGPIKVGSRVDLWAANDKACLQARRHFDTVLLIGVIVAALIYRRRQLQQSPEPSAETPASTIA